MTKRPVLLALALVSLGGSLATLPACDDPDPTEYKQKLKFFESDWLRKKGYVVNHTDEDPRARPPTKYADAAKGVGYALRHATTLDGTTVTISTWVFKSAKARDASLAGPFDEVTADLRKANLMFKKFAFDTPHMHGLMLLEADSVAMANQFELVSRSLPSEIAGAESFVVTN